MSLPPFDPSAHRPELLPVTSELACKEIGLDTDDARAAHDFEELFERLTAHVGHLLGHRLEYLFSMLYLMDVDETIVHTALRPDQAEEPARVIARAVLERLYRKALTRQQYGTHQGDWLPCEPD